jgi:hypothetical protein
MNVQGSGFLHWPSCEGCVRLTVDPALRSLGFVKNVGNTWDTVLGGGLCLETAVEEHPMPEDARQRIHVRFVQGSNTVTHRFEVATGVLRNAEITISGGVSGTELTFLMGRALGLDKSPDQINSVMSWPNTQRNAPGDNDQASLRALYGPPEAWCW